MTGALEGKNFLYNALMTPHDSLPQNSAISGGFHVSVTGSATSFCYKGVYRPTASVGGPDIPVGSRHVRSFPTETTLALSISNKLL